jgi:filamentous hemagglutinin
MSGSGIGAVLLLSCGSVSAQTNSWTSLTSDHWEAPDWSLGILPNSTQSIMITNAGYKAVGIFPSTVSDFPGSLTVSSLTISAPTNGLNVLLLNYSGTSVPLHVLGDCAIGENGTLLNEFGELQTDGGLYITSGGTVENDGGFLVIGGETSITEGTAVVNGDCVLDTCDLFSGQINQLSGTATISNLLLHDSTYLLSNGVVATTGTYCGSTPGPAFQQYGGTNNSATLVVGGSNLGYEGSGAYGLYGGTLPSSNIEIGFVGFPFDGSVGSLYQADGIVNASLLELGGFNSFSIGYYYLTNGVVACGQEQLIDGWFWQYGGAHTVTNTLDMEGDTNFNDLYGYGFSYCLFGGNLASSSLEMGVSSAFNQWSGTNAVSGSLSILQGQYNLLGGILSTSNTLLLPIEFTAGYTDSAFFQSGGVHSAGNALSNAGTYTLSGGKLVTPELFLSGTLTITNGAGAATLSAGTVDLAGSLQLWGTTQTLGTAVLSGNAQILFGSGANSLTFGPSAQATWNPGAYLSVLGWNGSTNGNGTDRLVFGTNATALTPAQVRQIVFVDPNGFVPGDFFAQVLPTGEVVPLPNPKLFWQSAGQHLVLTWSGFSVLQAATNVTGPYQDVVGVSSPYTNNFTSSPQQFFRLSLSNP